MKRRKTHNAWLKRHINDPFVKQSQRAGFRSRAVYKLEEPQAKHHFLKPGMTVVDLGAAPGAWSQLAAQIVGKTGRVVSVDLLAMAPIVHVTFLQGDFREESMLKKLYDAVGEEGADVVLSDMAPNFSGHKAVDQPRAMYLCELAMDCATQILKPGGDFFCKVFQGEGFEPFLQAAKAQFEKVSMYKPKASRDQSREQYLLARGLNR